MIQSAHDYDPERVDELEWQKDRAEAVLHDIRKQLEERPRLRKIFNQLLEDHGYEL